MMTPFDLIPLYERIDIREKVHHTLQRGLLAVSGQGELCEDRASMVDLRDHSAEDGQEQSVHRNGQEV